MSFSNPYVCENTKFWSLHIDPLTNNLPGKLSIASGKVANVTGMPSKYEIIATPLINNIETYNDGGLYIKNGMNGNLIAEVVENCFGYVGSVLSFIDNNGTDNGYISGLKAPIYDGDAANKFYVDSAVSNIPIGYPCTKLYDNAIDGSAGPTPTASVSGNGNQKFGFQYYFPVVAGGIYRVNFTGYVISTANTQGVGMGVGVILNGSTDTIRPLVETLESSTAAAKGSYCLEFTVPASNTSGSIAVYSNGNGGTITATMLYAYVQRVA